jgi:hypothetical protein
MFKINIKTKAGNDIKNKETFSVYFRLHYSKNVFTKRIKAYYTYSIMWSKGKIDPNKVMELKNSNNVHSLEDLTLKVIPNLCHVVANITKRYDLTPDYITFISPDLLGKKNKSFLFLKDIFGRKFQGQIPSSSFVDVLQSEGAFDSTWSDFQCSRIGIKKDELILLKEFVDANFSTNFRHLDPNLDVIKYKKSIDICNSLLVRMSGYIEENREI